MISLKPEVLFHEKRKRKRSGGRDKTTSSRSWTLKNQSAFVLIFQSALLQKSISCSENLLFSFATAALGLSGKTLFLSDLSSSLEGFMFGVTENLSSRKITFTN